MDYGLNWLHILLFYSVDHVSSASIGLLKILKDKSKSLNWPRTVEKLHSLFTLAYYHQKQTSEALNKRINMFALLLQQQNVTMQGAYMLGNSWENLRRTARAMEWAASLTLHAAHTECSVKEDGSCHKHQYNATSSQKTEFWAQIRHYMPCLRAWGCLTVLIDLKISLQDLQCICWLLSMQSPGFICMWQANCFQLFIILYLILVMFYNILRLNSQQSLTIHCTNIPRNRISGFK